ncbi:MAG TPA: sensor histidine kinase [Nitriliruptorales bacterium]
MTEAASGSQHDYPAWVAPLVAVPPVFFAVASAVGAQVWPVVALLVAVAIGPWLLAATGRQLPRTAFGLWVVLPLALLNLGGERFGVDLSAESHSQFSLMILVWLVGEMAAVAPLRHVLATTVAVCTVIVGRTVVAPDFVHAWVFWLGGAGIALLTGFMLRWQQQTLSELRAAQGALADEAAQRERQRIAREVHDVVAHTLTVTLMHLQAARKALDHDPTEAREALEHAEKLGRRSLADIRRTVGLLRTEGEPPEIRALPEAADVHALIESYRAAGAQLTTEVAADLRSLGPTSGLTLYRVLQESLSNAAAHAPGAPVEVTVRIERDEVAVEVTNPIVHAGVSPRPGGSGLEGMRERVGLLGGRFDASSHDGRWRVDVRFPTHSEVVEAGVTA